MTMWPIFAVLTLATLAIVVLPLWRAPVTEKRPARFATIVVAIVLPVGAGLLYAALGRPGLPDQPYGQRMRDPDFALEVEALALTQKLEQAPDAANYARLGEIVVEKNGGRVTREAGAMFAKALQIDPRRADARFFAGLALAQRGERDKALAVWRTLEKDSDANAPWLPMLRKSIAEMETAEEQN
jgi:cytochrome c-type biogenesis protein CcmH